MKNFPTLDELLDYGEDYKIPDLIKSDYFIVDNKRKQQNNEHDNSDNESNENSTDELEDASKEEETDDSSKESNEQDASDNGSDESSTNELEDDYKEDGTNDSSKESNEQDNSDNGSDEGSTDELEDDSKEEETNDNPKESNEQDDSDNGSNESNTNELEDASKEKETDDSSKKNNEQDASDNGSNESNTNELEDASKEKETDDSSKKNNEQDASDNGSNESSTNELEDDSKEDGTNDSSKESNEQNNSDNGSDESTTDELDDDSKEDGINDIEDSTKDENDFDDLLNNYDEDCKREFDKQENETHNNASNKLNDITPLTIYKVLKKLVSLSYENYQKGTYKYNKKEIIKHYVTEQKFKILDDLQSPIFKPDVYVFDLSPSNDNSLEMYVNAISSVAIKDSIIYLTFNNEILRKLIIKKQNSKSIDVREIVNSENEKYRSLECTVYKEFQSLYEELKNIKDRKIYIFSDLDISNDMVKLSKKNKNIVWFSTENNALFHSFFEREVPNDYEGLYVDTKDITDIEKYVKEKNKSKYRRGHI